MTALFQFIWYVFESLVNFLVAFVISDLGFSVASVILVFFVLDIVITYLVPGVSNVSSFIRNRK